MANEGSTKPTYSELEAENLRVRGLLQRQWISVEERLPPEGIDVSITVLSSCESYVWAGYYIPEHVGMPGQWFYSNHQGVKGRVTHWQPFPDLPNFPQSSSLVSQGAESADIGKLDTADKSRCSLCGAPRIALDRSGKQFGVCTLIGCKDPLHDYNRDKSGVEMGKVNRVTFSQGAPPMAGTPSIVPAGSAETGGEPSAGVINVSGEE